LQAESIAPQEKNRTMKTWIASMILIAAMGAQAQTPAQSAPVPVFAHPRFTLSTTAFEDGGIIPIRYSAASASAPVTPHLTWDYVPDGTVSFALIVVDPEVLINNTVTVKPHWLMFNIPGTARELAEGIPAVSQLPDGAIQLVSQNNTVGYTGMGAYAPGPYHHYTFQLFALDTKLNLGPGATMQDMENAMNGHILMKAEIVGRFHR
jgi:Raf kinase inhibitor-like YbhB/YbcL family protein